jgi:hypothetical protein
MKQLIQDWYDDCRKIPEERAAQSSNCDIDQVPHWQPSRFE